MTVVRVRGGPAGQQGTSGVVIDRTRVLTCSHVVNGRGQVLVGDVAVASAVVFDDQKLRVALLETEQPLGVPPAPLMSFSRFTPPSRLVVRGYLQDPAQQHVRTARIESVGGVTDSGLVQITTAAGDPQLDIGMSGGVVQLTGSPAVEPVVGLLVEVEGVQSVHRGGWFLPVDRIVADHSILRRYVAREWELDDDWRIFWNRRARGRLPGEERGWFYVGDPKALDPLATWWRDSAAEERLMLVIGEPGCGKSSLLSQLVAQSSPRFREEMIEAGEVPLFEVSDAPNAVLHLRAKTPEEVAILIDPVARALAFGTPQRVVADALDEARDPAGIAEVLSESVLRPGGRLLSAQLPSAANLWRDRAPTIELDLDSLRSVSGVRAAVRRRLIVAGLPTDQADRLAADIAAAANANHLVAALFADILSSTQDADASAFLSTTSSEFVRQVRAYLRAKFIDPATWAVAEPVLTGLAFAREPRLRIGRTWEILAPALPNCPPPQSHRRCSRLPCRRCAISSSAILRTRGRSSTTVSLSLCAVKRSGDCNSKRASRRT